ncbi:hypothetical protein Tco_0421061 [Tanacetum coccineum]
MPLSSWATRKPSPPCVGRGGPPVGSDKHHQQVWAAMGHLEEDWKCKEVVNEQKLEAHAATVTLIFRKGKSEQGIRVIHKCSPEWLKIKEATEKARETTVSEADEVGEVTCSKLLEALELS